MVLFVILAVIVAGVVISILLSRDLKRIVLITDTVQQINKSDDPSLRIQDTMPIQDEIGRLIVAFNETMGRLETIINSQHRFLADVSHELRTPMTIIKGNVDIMRRFGELDDESLNTIEAQTDRLTRLVNSLLLLEQVESGQVQVQKTAVNMADLLLEVFQELVLISEYKKQHMQVVEIDLAVVAGSRDQLKQVLLNLVSNAITYTPDGGDVFLSLKKEGNEVRIDIRDTGPGISEEDIPHLFERFYRGEKSRAWHRTSGFGLGLSISYWIVRNHNGRITVDSKMGEGTEFTIFLPLTGQGLDQE
jgi:signal transduction histidine kinase